MILKCLHLKKIYPICLSLHKFMQVNSSKFVCGMFWFFSPKAFLASKLCVFSHTSRFGFTACQYACLTIKWSFSHCFEAGKCTYTASLYVVIPFFFPCRKHLNMSASIWKTKKKLFSVTLKSLDTGKAQKHSFVSVNLPHSLKLKQHWFTMGLRVLYTTGVKFIAGQGSGMHQQRLASGP